MNQASRDYAARCQTDFSSAVSGEEISTRVDRMLEMIDSARSPKQELAHYARGEQARKKG